MCYMLSSTNIKVKDSIEGTLSLVLIFLVAILGIALRLGNLANVHIRSPDEAVYTHHACVILKHGVEAVKLLVREFNANKELWKYPPPYRVGYVLPIIFVMRATQNMDIKAGTYVSCFFSIISLLLLITFGLRFFNRWITLVALLFASVSPMDIALARRTWQDAMIGCLGLLLIYLSCEITRPIRKIIWYIPFIIVGSYSVLIKESLVLIYVLCLSYILQPFIIKKKLLKGVILMSVSALGMGVSIAILLNIVGGISNVAESMRHFREIIGTADYGVKYCSGPWFQIIKGFWLLTPVSTILCIGATILTFLHTRSSPEVIDKNRRAIFCAVFVTTTYIIIITSLPNLKNLRYLSPIYMPFYLMSGLGIWYVILFIRAKLKNIVFHYFAIISIIIFIVVTAAFDYQRFNNMIVKTGIKDLAIVPLDNIHHNMPPYN